MAAFPYDKHHPFLHDPSLMFLIPDTDTTTNMSCFSEQSLHDSYKPYSSPHDQLHPFVDQADPTTVEVLSSVNVSSTDITCINNFSSSAVSVDQYHQVISNPMEKSKNNFQQPHSKLKDKKPTKETTSSSNTDEGCISLRPEEKLNNKRRGRRSGDNDKKKKETRKNSAPTGYVYVRARRGQATDSHSLAERVRREQIRERMELLQSLVPGCDKITGKALMLDQVINYVQTLKNQVEYLSLKIASISPLFNDEYGMNLDAIMAEQELQKQRMISLEEARDEADVQQQNQNQATNDIFNTSDCYEEQNHSQATNSIFKTYTSDDYSLIDTSTFLQQAQMSNIMSQSQQVYEYFSEDRRVLSSFETE